MDAFNSMRGNLIAVVLRELENLLITERSSNERPSTLSLILII